MAASESKTTSGNLQELVGAHKLQYKSKLQYNIMPDDAVQLKNRFQGFVPVTTSNK
jgi:hypothetical protein